MGTAAPFTLIDSRGRQYVPTDQGYGSILTYREEAQHVQTAPTANPGIPIHMYESFQVSGEDVSYTLRGADLVCPQCGKGFKVALGSSEAFAHPTPLPGTLATAVASASANTSSGVSSAIAGSASSAVGEE